MRIVISGKSSTKDFAAFIHSAFIQQILTGCLIHAGTVLKHMEYISEPKR